LQVCVPVEQLHPWVVMGTLHVPEGPLVVQARVPLCPHAVHGMEPVPR